MKEGAVEALLDYGQADEDGIIVTTSRQAIHEVVDGLREAEARAEEAERLLEALGAKADELVNALCRDSRGRDVVGDTVEYHLEGQKMYHAINDAREIYKQIRAFLDARK